MKMAILTATVPFGMLASTSASAELSASATVASSYLWRGYELGSGTPAVSADLVYSNSGFYAGVWVSSGDTFTEVEVDESAEEPEVSLKSTGTEYDLFIGYGGSIGENFSYDLSYITYIYPTGGFDKTEQAGDFAEAVLNVGLGPVSITYKENVAGNNGSYPRYALPEDYSYVSIDTSAGDFGFTLGAHDGGASDATHFDVSYAATENLAFTFSTILDSDDTASEKGPIVVASYSIPLL